MTTAPQIERPQSIDATTATLPGLKWKLVHAEPGHLVFALPGLMPAAHPLVRHGAGRSGGWVPSGSPVEHHVPEAETSNEHPALEYARYIGRVGVLAAALGVGAALAGQQAAIALAEPTDSDSSTSTASEAGPSPAETSTSRETSTSTSTVSSPDDTQSVDAPADTEAPATSPSESSMTETAPGSIDSEVEMSSSPDAPSSTAEAAEQTNPTAETSDTAEPAAPLESAPDPVVEQTAPAPETEPAPVANTPTPVGTAERGETGSEARRQTTSEAAAGDARATAGPTTAPTPETLQAPTSLTAEPATASAPPLSATVAPAEPIAETAPVAPVPVSIVSRFVNTVLAPFSPTTATPAAAEAAQAPVVWGLFAWIRRSFFNSTPTLALDPTQTVQVDDTITGRLIVNDTDGDPVILTASTPVSGGAVVVHPDGTFTYTVPATMYDTGGTDTFTVTATDAGTYPHLHGISGFLNVITFGWLGDDGHDVSTAVTLTINAAPIPAIPAYTLGTVDHGTGAIPGSLHVTDPDQDTLTYNVNGGPADGSVVLNATTGTFTYTPTPIARHEASAEDATPDQLADDFTVTVDDSHGGVITVPVTVSIDPANLAPAMTLVVSDPNSDGSVDVLVTVNDPTPTRSPTSSSTTRPMAR